MIGAKGISAWLGELINKARWGDCVVGMLLSEANELKHSLDEARRLAEEWRDEACRLSDNGDPGTPVSQMAVVFRLLPWEVGK